MQTRRKRYAAGLALLLFAAMLSSCSGRKMSFPEAQTYLASHRQDLMILVQEIETCKPVWPEAGVYQAIRGSSVGDNPTCSPGAPVDMTKILADMAHADVQMLDFSATDTGVIYQVRFNYYGAGLGVSGGGDWIIYEAVAGTLPAQMDQDQEQRPLDAPPHHWFWIRT